jgi:Spy/CpxP family protein refolding chaperone
MRRSMSIIAMSLVFLFVVVGNVLAQGMRMSPEERTDMMAKQLSLTDDQKVKVLEIFKKQDEARRAAYEKSDGDREAMRPVMKQIREDSDKKLKTVLTEKQWEEFEKQRAEMMSRAPAPPPKY